MPEQINFLIDNLVNSAECGLGHLTHFFLRTCPLFPVFSIWKILGMKNLYQNIRKTTLGIMVAIVIRFDTLLSIRLVDRLKGMKREGFKPLVNNSLQWTTDISDLGPRYCVL